MAEQQQITIGESIDLAKPSNYVQLPDGTVVTARQHYTVQHVGHHVAGSIEFDGVKPGDPVEDAEPKTEAPKPPVKSTSKK